MIDMLENDTIRALQPATNRAAATAIANTGHRLGATTTEIRTTLAILFGKVRS